MNSTTDDIEADVLVGIIVIPLFLGLMIYLATALFVWPYARPIFPFYWLLLFILVPPLFPFLLLYMLFFVLWPIGILPARRRVVVVQDVAVEASTRGRVRPAGVVVAVPSRSTRPSSGRGNRV